MKETPSGILCLPGQRLSLLTENRKASHGTYVFNGYIYSNLIGTAEIIVKDDIEYVEIKSPFKSTLVPSIGDVVSAKVQSIGTLYCKCIIMYVGNDRLEKFCKGILRKEDIRSTEKHKVEIYKNFRPGDVILARVLPFAEPDAYYLSTAEKSLGVVYAHSANGYKLVPLSWTEMICSKTGVKESRKLAKIIPEQITENLPKFAKMLADTSKDN